jgi:hypothetical protein
VTPRDHPNHFIILVDASGSVASVPSARAALRAAIEERLVPRLYRQGFGGAIPPYDPRQDFISLYHFGIVSQGPTPAYLRLRDYDFLTDFIHPVLRDRRVTPEELAESAMPPNGYELTILSWARPLAVAAAGRGASERVSNRTFLISLHDGIPNNSSSRAEEADVQRWANPANRRAAEEVIARVSRDYRFVGVDDGGEQAARAPAAAHIFMEVVEIVPAAQDALEERAKSLDPFGRLSFSWTEEGGERPAGLLSAEMDADFLSWVRSAGGASGRVAAGAGDAEPAARDWDLSPEWTLPFVAEGPLDCEPRRYTVSVEVPVKSRDEILGARTLLYTARREFETPAASRCTYAFVARRAGAAGLLLLLLAAAAYFVYFRFFSTHLHVELPGLAIPIRVARAGTVEGGTPISPREGLEAFTLRVPAGMLQRIFYRNASVSVEIKGGRSVSLAEGGASLSFPTSRESVDAYWDSVPDRPTRLTLTFEQGGRASHVSLSYPKGIS